MGDRSVSGEADGACSHGAIVVGVADCGNDGTEHITLARCLGAGARQGADEHLDIGPGSQRLERCLLLGYLSLGVSRE